jgi:hypothetical protein
VQPVPTFTPPLVFTDSCPCAKLAAAKKATRKNWFFINKDLKDPLAENSRTYFHEILQMRIWRV